MLYSENVAANIIQKITRQCWREEENYNHKNCHQVYWKDIVLNLDPSNYKPVKAVHLLRCPI